MMSHRIGVRQGQTFWCLVKESFVSIAGEPPGLSPLPAPTDNCANKKGGGTEPAALLPRHSGPARRLPVAAGGVGQAGEEEKWPPAQGESAIGPRRSRIDGQVSWGRPPISRGGRIALEQPRAEHDDS